MLPNNSLPVFYDQQDALFKVLSNIYLTLNASHCFIANIEAKNTEITTSCYLKQGKPAENLSFQLLGSPSEMLLHSGKNSCHSTSIRQHFPDDEILQTLDVTGYLGTLLRNKDNIVIGLLVCLFDHKLDNPEQHLSWITQYSDVVSRVFWQEQSNLKIKQLEKQLAETEKLSNIGSWQLILADNEYRYSIEISRIFEQHSCTDKLSLMQMLDYIHPEDRAAYVSKLSALKNAEIEKFENLHRVKLDNGRIKFILEKTKRSYSNSHKGYYLEGKSQDISLLYQLNTNKRLTDYIFDQTSEAVMITDTSNKITYVNKALLRITGYSRSELINQTPKILSSGRQSPTFYQEMWTTLLTKGQWRGELYNRRKNGQIYPEELSVNAVKDSDGTISHFIAIFRDVTHWKNTERELRFYAECEPLTGLNNRRIFNDKLENTLEEKQQDTNISVIFIDLDDFKLINDIYGHDIGDSLLKTVALRLNKIVSNSDTLCRYGGDEFTLLLTDTNLQKTQIVLKQIQASLECTFKLDEHLINISASIGIAMLSDTVASAKQLLRYANHAMRFAKSKGRNNLCFHNADMEHSYQNKLQLKERLEQAIQEQQLQVYYQPIMDIKLNRIAKFEALVRWPDGEGGFISPEKFIPIAEEFGLIHLIGEFVCRRACNDLKTIHQAGYPYICMSINRSIKEFVRNEVEHNKITSIIKKSGIPYESIVIEITESTAMSENFYAKQALTELRRTGIKIALDDFCTGYSSLNYLVDYEIDFIKIDRTFTKKINSDNKSKILTATLLVLADKLGIEVIAEGVEDLQQLTFLNDNHCQFIQGFYFSPALDIQKCLKLLSQPTQTELC